MEKFEFSRPGIAVQPESVNNVESAANFEGNASEALISRLRHPEIKKQLVDIRYAHKCKDQEEITGQNWVDWAPEGWEGKEKFKRGELTGKILNADFFEEQLNAPRITHESVAEEVNADIQKMADSTPIDYTTNEPDADVMPLNWTVPWTGKKPTTKQMSIIEAHEKGHNIRTPQIYDELTDIFRTGFDIEKANYTEAHHEMMQKGYESWTDKHMDVKEPPTFEEARQNYLYNYLFSPIEIAERMSQLKNYFGFTGAEVFTKEHLYYAKKHYVEDTDMDNSMTLFFEAITPETEDRFIELINTMGI